MKKFINELNSNNIRKFSRSALLNKNINNDKHKKDVIIKDWLIQLKFIIFLLFIITFIYKLLGYNLIDIFINDKSKKVFMCIIIFVVIIILLLNLYVLHIFYTRKSEIPEILPESFKDWLKECKCISGSKVIFQRTKDGIYKDLAIYLLLALIALFVF